jgi:hypothetical protein
MAVSQTSLADVSSSIVFTDTDSVSTPTAVKASSGTMYAIDIDNTLNAAVSYVKLYNVASGSVTAGTTAPDMILLGPVSARINYPIPQGLTFGTAITVRTVTAGGTAGTTDPTSDVTIRIVYV